MGTLLRASPVYKGITLRAGSLLCKDTFQIQHSTVTRVLIINQSICKISRCLKVLTLKRSIVNNLSCQTAILAFPFRMRCKQCTITLPQVSTQMEFSSCQRPIRISNQWSRLCWHTTLALQHACHHGCISISISRVLSQMNLAIQRHMFRLNQLTRLKSISAGSKRSSRVASRMVASKLMTAATFKASKVHIPSQENTFLWTRLAQHAILMARCTPVAKFSIQTKLGSTIQYKTVHANMHFKQANSLQSCYKLIAILTRHKASLRW